VAETIYLNWLLIFSPLFQSHVQLTKWLREPRSCRSTVYLKIAFCPILCRWRCFAVGVLWNQGKHNYLKNHIRCKNCGVSIFKTGLPGQSMKAEIIFEKVGFYGFIIEIVSWPVSEFELLEFCSGWEIKNPNLISFQSTNKTFCL